MSMFNGSDDSCVFHEPLTETIEQPYWIRCSLILCLICIFVIGVSGNLVTCIVIYCDKNMHTATNYYLFNLAVSDLIVTVGLLLDLNAFMDYPISFEGYSDMACQAHFFLVVALWNNGILIMTALAIERYIAIWHPMLLNKRPLWRRVTKIIYLIWIVAILEALPEIWTVRLIKINSSMMCFIVPTTFARLLNSILALVTFVIPLGIMMFVYTMIAFKMNITQKSYSRNTIFNHRNNSGKVKKLVIALTVSFMVCWLPFFTLRVLVVVADWCKTSWYVKHWELLLMLCSLNSWFSTVLNPMLFSLMSTKFRKALRALWNTKIAGRQESVLRTQTVTL